MIIGAGISGLEAGRLLGEQGVKTLILEGRNRTGGRIHSIRSEQGHVVDLGATWIHGIHGSIPTGIYSNPLWDLTQEANLPTRGTEALDFQIFSNDNNLAEDVVDWLDEFMRFVREETRLASADISFGHYATLFVKEKQFDSKQEEIFYSSLHYLIENTEGAQLNEISAKGVLDLTTVFYGEEHMFHQDGFMALTDYIAKSAGEIQLNKIVKQVNVKDTSVEVLTQDGRTYRSRYVLMTVPLGVLKSRQITFEPALPRWKLNAIDRLGYGHLEKAILVWDKAWWNSTHLYFLRVSPKITHFGYWVNLNKWNDKPALISFFPGNSEYRQRFINDKQKMISDIHLTLQEMFPNTDIPMPSESYLTTWREDPFSLGSYSYISVNQKYEDPSYLGEPIGDRLLFAGEATSQDSYGFAHGALLSARREVTRLLYAYDPSY